LAFEPFLNIHVVLSAGTSGDTREWTLRERVLYWGCRRFLQRKFYTLRLRVHMFLADAPLDEVWAVDLPAYRDGVSSLIFSQDGINRLLPETHALVRFRLSWADFSTWGWTGACTDSLICKSLNARRSGTHITQLDAAKSFPGRITTGITLLKGFCSTEDYQQDYVLHHADNLYILIVRRLGHWRSSFPIYLWS